MTSLTYIFLQFMIILLFYSYLCLKNQTIMKRNQQNHIARRRFFALCCFSLLTLGIAMAQSGYPYTQVPFTSVKITPNTFWGDRIQAAREVTIPLAFS